MIDAFFFLIIAAIAVMGLIYFIGGLLKKDRRALRIGLVIIVVAAIAFSFLDLEPYLR